MNLSQKPSERIEEIMLKIAVEEHENEIGMHGFTHHQETAIREAREHPQQYFNSALLDYLDEQHSKLEAYSAGSESGGTAL